MGTDEQAVRETHAAWIEAVNAGGLDRLMGMMADDVVFINPGRPAFGRDVFRDHFSAAHEQSLIRCVSELEEVVVVGEVAYTRSRDSVTVSPRAGGGESRFAGDRLTVYRKQPDGRWLLARDAHGLSPVTAE